MLQHVLIGDVGPALILLALSGPLLFFFLPRPALLSIARSRRARAVLAWLTNPYVAFGVWVRRDRRLARPGALRRGARRARRCTTSSTRASWSPGSSSGTSCSIPPATALRRSGRLGLVVALFAAGQILTMVLVFSFEPLYPAYAAQPERLLGLSPLTDQRLAGVAMMVDQVVMLGTLAALLLLATGREQRRRDDDGRLDDRRSSPCVRPT